MNQAFDPATFLDVGNMSDAQVKALGQRDDIDHLPRRPVMSLERTRQLQEALTIAGDLKAAAKYYAANEHKPFCVGKAATCLDMAAKLERFGSFASEAQAGFARKLIDWSVPAWERPRQEAPAKAPSAPVAAPQPAPAPVTLPKLHDVMQKHAKFYVGGLTLARKQGAQLIWIKHTDAEKVIGKLDNAVLTLWNRPGVDMADVRDLLAELEADPQAAARKYGKLAGRCCSCGADLVDPESIARGQGPICAGKF